MAVDGAPPTLVSRRFDRVIADDVVNRLHQEDCCQALGLPPSRKYASTRTPKGDDPSYGRIASALLSFSGDPAAELEELLRQMTVNVALGNTDAHAKNYAFLYDDAFSPRLSPMYDVAPVIDIEPSGGLLSLRINGRMEAESVGRGDLVAEARSWGIEEGVALKVVGETLERLVAGVERACACYPDTGALFAPTAMRRVERLLEG